MSEVKLPLNIEEALVELNKIIEESKSVPLKDSLIMVDKNALTEVYTKINREKNRIQELKNDYLLDAENQAKSIIVEAKNQASQIVESSIKGTPLESDANVKIALQIKENAMDFLGQTLIRLNKIMTDYNELFTEVGAHVAEINKNKM